MNYVHVDDVIEALYICATDPGAVGETFNLSQTTTVENMVEALMAGIGLSVKPYRLPFLPVYIMAVLCGWVPGFPLTRTRVNALTGKCRYSSNNIERELGFRFGSSLDDRFMDFGVNACKGI